jgi:hypothetical protein
MPLDEIAFVVGGVLLGGLSLMQERMLRQVQQSDVRHKEISFWNWHFAHNLFGLPRIWKLHKRTYERSSLRSWFVAVFITFLVFLILVVYELLYVRSRH